MGVRAVPAPAGALVAARGHALRRRAADAGGRTRADVPPQGADDGRAVPRSRAAGGAGHLRHHPRDQPPGRDHPAHRAERQHGAQDRRPRLRAGNRHDHHAGHRRGAAGGRKRQGSVSGEEAEIRNFSKYGTRLTFLRRVPFGYFGLKERWMKTMRP